MIKKNYLPDKVFGIDSRLFLLWLEPFGLLLVFILSFGLVILPKINEASEKINQIKQLTSKISEVNQKRNYLQTVDQEEIKNNAAKLSAGLLAEKNAYLLVGVVRNAAAVANYSIDDFAISLGDVKGEEANKNDKTSLYDKIPVSVTVVGPSDNYLTLIKTIERSLPVMSIDNFEMESSLDGVSTIKLSVSAYYLRDISSLKLENLTLSDLTPSQGESDLLSKISDYKTMTVSSNSNENFIKYQRQDPFFTL